MRRDLSYRTHLMPFSYKFSTRRLAGSEDAPYDSFDVSDGPFSERRQRKVSCPFSTVLRWCVRQYVVLVCWGVHVSVAFSLTGGHFHVKSRPFDGGSAEDLSHRLDYGVETGDQESGDLNVRARTKSACLHRWLCVCMRGRIAMRFPDAGRKGHGGEAVSKGIDLVLPDWACLSVWKKCVDGKGSLLFIGIGEG